MQTSLFIARLLGPVLAIMGVAILMDPERIRQMAREAIGSDMMIFMSGVITLPVGLAIVNTHNVWSADWRMIISLFGWLAVFAGIARMTMTGPLKTIARSMIEKSSLFQIPAVLMTALGLYLSYKGYLS
jgi:hypothetical protein